MIRPAEPCDAAVLIALWRRSVEATHDFLTPEDIMDIEAEVIAYLSAPDGVWVLMKDEVALGFMGIAGSEISTLFVDEGARGKGVGRCLMAWAFENGCDRVEVNEQNSQAVGFYEHMGFQPISRAPYDSAGRPFPIVTMARNACV